MHLVVCYICLSSPTNSASDRQLKALCKLFSTLFIGTRNVSVGTVYNGGYLVKCRKIRIYKKNSPLTPVGALICRVVFQQPLFLISCPLLPSCFSSPLLIHVSWFLNSWLNYPHWKTVNVRIKQSTIINRQKLLLPFLCLLQCTEFQKSQT